MKKLLVAIDGSEPSTRAAKFAAALARGLNAELTLVHSISPIMPFPGDLPLGITELNASLERFGERVLRQTRDCLEPDTSSVKTRVIHGSPAASILHLAQQEGYDLLVVGSRGGNGLSRLVLGSVADRLVRASEIPVTVVH